MYIYIQQRSRAYKVMYGRNLCLSVSKCQTVNIYETRYVNYSQMLYAPIIITLVHMVKYSRKQLQW